MDVFFVSMLVKNKFRKFFKNKFFNYKFKKYIIMNEEGPPSPNM